MEVQLETREEYNKKNADDNSVIIVEGYFDVIACHQAGYKNVVGLCGTALTEKQCLRMMHMGFKKFILALDNDEAGQLATIRANDMIKKAEKNFLRMVLNPKLHYKIGTDTDDFAEWLWWEDMIKREFEPKHKIKLMETEREFVRGIVNEDRQWVKERKLEYLKGEKSQLEAKSSDLSDQIVKAGKSKSEWLAEYWFEELEDVFRKLRQIDRTIDSWENVKYRDTREITMEDVVEAKQVPCTEFIDTEMEYRNGKFKASCPFHNEKTPSFYIFEETNRYHCFGCKKNGDVIQLVMEKNSLDFFQAVRFLLKKY